MRHDEHRVYSNLGGRLYRREHTASLIQINLNKQIKKSLRRCFSLLPIWEETVVFWVLRW